MVITAYLNYVSDKALHEREDIEYWTCQYETAKKKKEFCREYNKIVNAESRKPWEFFSSRRKGINLRVFKESLDSKNGLL